MSHAKDQRAQAAGRGAPRKASRAEALRRDNKRDTEARFVDVPGIAAVLDAITVAGDAIILGRTSDGGAISMTLLHDDGSRTKEYAVDQDQLNDKFAWFGETYFAPEAPE